MYHKSFCARFTLIPYSGCHSMKLLDINPSPFTPCKSQPKNNNIKQKSFSWTNLKLLKLFKLNFSYFPPFSEKTRKTFSFLEKTSERWVCLIAKYYSEGWNKRAKFAFHAFKLKFVSGGGKILLPKHNKSTPMILIHETSEKKVKEWKTFSSTWSEKLSKTMKQIS